MIYGDFLSAFAYPICGFSPTPRKLHAPGISARGNTSLLKPDGGNEPLSLPQLVATPYGKFKLFFRHTVVTATTLLKHP